MAEIVQNTTLGTRRKLELLLQEMDTICREIILQMHNSSSSTVNNNNNLDTQTLIDMLIERQDYLTQQIIIVRQHQDFERQLQLKRDEILKCERALRCLQTYLLQAVQVLSSAVYQAREKLANIRQSKSFPSETIIRYAHQLATCYSTTAPENWQQGDIRRPYPTNTDMRRGLLGRISEQTLQHQQQQINIQNPTINSTTVVDSSTTQNTSTTSYTAVTTAARPPKHDTTSFASDIFSGIYEETNNTNLSSSDTDSDDDLL
jgi:mediator of RNA polymerase II transcription subunit 4